MRIFAGGANLAKGLAIMVSEWAVEELDKVNLNDKRLNQRMGIILSQLGHQPKASIPSANGGGWAETNAAYRFFANEKVTFENILEPHIEATFRRVKEQSVVIAAQDTTEIEITRPQQKVSGAGPLDDGSRWGGFLHPLMAFTPGGTPLGTLYAEAWTRDLPGPDKRTKQQKEYDRKHTPIEDKESVRWVDTLIQVQQAASDAPDTQFVMVADSEADIFELFEASEQAPHVDWIVRACQDRALQKPAENTDDTDASAPLAHLREQVLSSPVLFTNQIYARGRKLEMEIDKRARNQPRESRHAEVEVRASTVTLRAPWRSDRVLPDVSVNVVLVTEVNPPSDDIPIEWMLLTSLPIETVEQVRLVVQYYPVRWMIEVFFRTLKSGCCVEDRLFQSMDRVWNCVAIYMIVSWRTLMVVRLGREFPDIDCEAVFEPDEWKSVYYVVHQEPPPEKPPTLQQMVRMIGQLGGYINRARTDEPGPQTVAIGIQRAYDITICWKTFGPEAKKEETTCV
jgi:hypothetical protein